MALVDHAVRQLRHPQRRTIVPLHRRSADEDDELAVADVTLPVELLAAGPLALDELLAHRLAGEVERALADGGVAVGVGRAEAVTGEPVDELAATSLQAA